MIWEMFCWETLGPAIHVHVNLEDATYLNIFADQVQRFMTMAFPGGSGLFQQQDNATCHTAHKCSGQIPHIVKKWFTL